MSAIDAINMLNNTSTINWAVSVRNNRLTAHTKARLHALGVDTSRIRTEEEGQEALREASFRRERIATHFQTPKTNDLVREMQEQIQLLLRDLGLSIDPNEDYYKTVYRIKNKIAELKSAANDDKGKIDKINGYVSRLGYIDSMHKSQIDLGATMSITANANLAYHGLF